MTDVNGGFEMMGECNQSPLPVLSPSSIQDNERFHSPGPIDDFTNATFDESAAAGTDDGLMSQNPILSLLPEGEQVSSPECERRSSCGKDLSLVISEFSNFTIDDRKDTAGVPNSPGQGHTHQNQAHALPVVNEEEQFFSTEAFSNANTAMDWDALLNRGNSNVQVSLSKWERDSLYVKFDPLIASRNTDHRVSNIFKAPKPPGPLTSQQLPPPQNGDLSRTSQSCNNTVNISSNETYKTAFQDLSNSMPLIDEENGNVPVSPTSATNEDDADSSFHSTRMNSTRSIEEEGEVHEEEEVGNKSVTEKDTPTAPVSVSANGDADHSLNNSVMNASKTVESVMEEEDIANGNVPRSPSIGNGDAENSFQRSSLNTSGVAETILATTVNSSERSTSEPKQEEANPHAEQLKRIAELKEHINALQEEFEIQKKRDKKMISSQELHLSDGVNGYLKTKEHFEKGKTEQQDMIRERDEALADLRTMESAFASMLLMYEDIKTCQGYVEKNIEALKEREPVLEYALQRRDARDESARGLLENALQQMAHDFDTKVKDRESENVKLKTKLRMLEMKISNLEGEIEQVDRENVKLRGLCDDLLRR